MPGWWRDTILPLLSPRHREEETWVFQAMGESTEMDFEEVKDRFVVKEKKKKKQKG